MKASNASQRRSRRKPSWESTTSMVAIILSIISLGLHKCQYDQTQKIHEDTKAHDALLLMPKLELHAVFRSTSQTSGLYLRNSGLGPALIKQLNIVYLHSLMPDWRFMNWYSVMYAGIENYALVTRGDIFDDSYIEAGKSVDLFVTPSSNVLNQGAFESFFRLGVAFQVNYCAIDGANCKSECLSLGDADLCRIEPGRLLMGPSGEVIRLPASGTE